MTNKILKKGLKALRVLFLTVVFLLFMGGCGLPQYETVAKPEVISQVGNANELSFTTPTDSKIIGYDFYYKIYDDTETALIATDAALFDSDNYDSDLGESIPTGNTLLSSNDFFSMTKSGYNFFIDPIFNYTTSGIIIKIDFSIQSVQPKLLVNLSSVAEMELRRGSKGSDTSSNNDSAVDFLSFTDNDYDGVATDIDNDLVDMLTRVPSASGPTIYISVCVYSVGLDLTTMSQLESEPVFLGTLAYDSFSIVGATH